MLAGVMAGITFQRENDFFRTCGNISQILPDKGCKGAAAGTNTDAILEKMKSEIAMDYENALIWMA